MSPRKRRALALVVIFTTLVCLQCAEKEGPVDPFVETEPPQYTIVSVTPSPARIEPGEEAELELGDLASSDDEKELELDFVSDAISPEIEKGAVNEKEVGEEETGSAEGGGQESIQKEESEKDSEEGALDLGDLELKLDLDEDEDSKE